MIRLILVDDQTLVRAGIRGLLELNEDIRVVAQAADGQEAVELIARERPDLVLLDVRLPKLSGIGVIQALAARKCLPPVLLLTTFDDDEALLEGMRAGARPRRPGALHGACVGHCAADARHFTRSVQPIGTVR